MSEDFATNNIRICYILIAKNKILMLKPKIAAGHKYARGPYHGKVMEDAYAFCQG